MFVVRRQVSIEFPLKAAGSRPWTYSAGLRLQSSASVPCKHPQLQLSAPLLPRLCGLELHDRETVFCETTWLAVRTATTTSITGPHGWTVASDHAPNHLLLISCCFLPRDTRLRIRLPRAAGPEAAAPFRAARQLQLSLQHDLLRV